ncbi:MAG: NYN domain-containing protein [Terriglobales bacterium]
MKRHAIFVDAGYVFAQGSVSLSGSKIPRTQLKLDATEITAQLTTLALARGAGVPLLRIYWYDGALNRPTVEHLALANTENVKLRLGTINSAGEQKEVDSLLVTDLIDLARNQSICDATVVTADTDVRIAVQVAQTFGVRVHLIGLEPSRASQSPSLRQEADTVHEIAKADVAKFLKVLTAGPPKPAVALAPAAVVATGPKASASVGPAKTIDQVIDEAIQQILAPPLSDVPALKAALAASSGVPMEYDRRLLGTCRTLLQRDLTGDERREMRSLFKKRVLAS